MPKPLTDMQLAAQVNGYRVAPTTLGDPWTLPTILAVHHREIVRDHRGTHPGDHPEVGAIPSLLEAGP